MRSAPREFDTEEEVMRYNHGRYPALSEEAIRHRVQYNFQRLPSGKYTPKYDPLRVAQGLTHIPDDLTRYAQKVTCPVAFIIGSRSTQLTRSQAEEVAACYKETKVHMYEVDAGNVLQVENPGGLVQAIKEFTDLL
jgi:pimeloyl-ACP methyl ester carboxylesterase